MPYDLRQQEKQVFENYLCKCVTRQDLSEVPLITINLTFEDVNMCWTYMMTNIVYKLIILCHILYSFASEKPF